MRKQSVVLVFIFLLLLTISGQTTLSRLWALGNDNQPIHAAAQTGSPARQPASTFLTGPAAGDPVDIALTYLRQQATTLGLHAADLADLVVTDRYVTQHNGVTHLYLRQRYHGIAVFNGVVNINISRSGEVINLGNRFVPNLAQAVNTETPALTAPAAVEYAAQGLKLTLTAPVYIVEDRNGPAREVQLSMGGIAKTAIPAKLVYQRQADGKLHLAWSLIIEPLADQHRWHLRVDAVNGAILVKEDLILHDSWAPSWSVTKHQEQPPITDAVTDAATGGEQPASPLTPPTYRVFPLPLEHPDDGPSLPNSQAVVNNPADALASPYGWHDIDGQPGHEFSDTRGNNVAAQEDRNDDNADGFRPTGKKPKKFNFDYPFDPTRNPIEGNNPAVAIINLFYWNNILHDIAYRYGFDEVSGNFQENSYGRGGLGADAIQADAQDGYDFGARNNAYFMTAPDGEPPRLGTFVFDLTTPNRDSALDNGIVIHEYAHGISTRLVGGPSNIYCLNNAEQMGEGWSDWFMLALTTKASDTGAKARSFMTYPLGQPLDGPGVRRYLYSTDMTIDPFTYQDLKTTSDIYIVGQIWASMLWDLQWNLIAQHGFDPNFYTGSGGNNLALRLVMDGMKFVPCEPGFVDARDAILLADQVNNNGANQCTIWQTFAKRGLGWSARQGSPYHTFDGVAAFDLPTICRDDLSLTKRGVPDLAEAGKVLTYELVASNYTAQPLTGLVLSDPIPAHTNYVAGSASDGGSEVGGSVTWQLPVLNPDESAVRTFQVMIDRAYPDPVELFLDDMENGGTNWAATGLWHLQADAEPCGNSASPTHSWYYGQAPDCLYTDNSSGELTTVNPIALPDGKVTLKFMSWEAYESCCDGVEALVATDGVNFSRVWHAGQSSNQWHEVTADLSAYAGQSIWLRFAFRSDGSVTARGWYLDDVQLIVAQAVMNSATLTSNEGLSTTATSQNQVIKTPEIDVSPLVIEATLNVGAKVVHTLTITNSGTAPLHFALGELAQPTVALTSTSHAVIGASAPPLPQALPGQPTMPTAVSYAGERLNAHSASVTVPKHAGLTGSLTLDTQGNPNVLLLAAGDVLQIQALLATYADLGQIDIYDAHLDTPTLAQLAAYDTIIVIANNAFANPTDVGDRLAEYVDDGGTVIQTVATFYDSSASGWSLQGRWINEGYSPLIGSGDWFAFASLGDFDATHPIMQGVDEAGDYFRQVMELAPDAELVATWSDDEFVATKARVVALNTFLADGFAWTGDVDLVVHNSIIWLQTQTGADAAWLAATPVTGTVAVEGVQTIAVTIDAGAPEIGNGEYRALLRVRSNDRDEANLDIPVTLHALGPELSIGRAQSYFGRPVQLPVNFRSNGLAIAAMAFSIDFDEQCLRFDPADADNNGIPDAITLTTPPGFEVVAHADLSDVNSEIDLFIGDLTPPLTALPDGALLTLDFKALCQPQATPLTVRVGFGAQPPASFSDLNGVSRPGQLLAGAVEIQVGLPGDCNQDGLVNAADSVACVLESFDGDGSFWLDAPGGAFAGSPHGCDSNLDEQIDAGDILCTVLTIFQGQGACNGAVGAATGGTPAVAVLAIPDDLVAQPGGQVTVPVHLTSNGNTIGATVFALTFDPAVLTLDQTDGDGNGIPDAIAFNLPAGVTASVQVVDNRQIQIAIADLGLPFVALPDGALAQITFTAGAQTQTSAITFAGTLRASVGTHTGQSAAVTTDDGAVRIVLAPTGEALVEKAYLPWIER